MRTYNEPMRRVNWTVTEAQHQALKRLSERTGLSISELVRRSLDEYLSRVASGSSTPFPSASEERTHEPE